MHKDNRKKPASDDSSTQELLRQLRMQYEQERPEDVFEDDVTESVIDEADAAENEEITRRIMEMFSATAQATEEPDEENVTEPDEPLALPEDDADIEVEVDAEAQDEDEIDVDQEPQAPQSLPEEDADATLPLPEDYEGEVSDAALPDYDDALEDAQESVPILTESAVTAPEGEGKAAMAASEPQEEEPDDTEEIEKTMEQEAAAPDEPEQAASDALWELAPQEEQADEPMLPAMEPEEQPAEAAVPHAAPPEDTTAPTDTATEAADPQTDAEPPATTEAADPQTDAEPPATTEAALPLSEGEGEAVAPIEADATETLPDMQPQEAAPPVELAEDELLLDEYDELPVTPAATQDAEQPLPVLNTAPQVSPDPKRVTPRPSPLDAALTAQRKKHEAQGSRHAALRAAETLSEEDVLLLLRLGYENELRGKQSPEMLERVRENSTQPPLSERQKFHLAFGWRESDSDETPKAAQIKETYRKNAVGVAWRLVVCCLFALLTLALDLSALLLPLLPAAWADMLSHPSAHMLGLQLLVLCAIPSGRRLIYGARQLLCLTPEPCSVVLPVLLCNLAYDLVMTLQTNMYVLLNFPTALLCFLLVVCDALDLRRERITFSVVSSTQSKRMLLRTQPRKKKVVRGGRIVKIINDDADRVHYAVERAEHVDGYFYRTNQATPRYRAMLPLLALQLLLSFGISGLCTVVTGLTPTALTVLLLSMQLSAPTACLIVYAYSMLLACRRLQARGATIVGQSTVDEMGADKLLIFPDTDMLQAKSSTEITVKGTGDPRRYVRYARRLFYALGGTLAKINTSDLSEDRMDGQVEILRIYPEGVEARLDGRVRVLAGSSAFLSANGVRVPATNAELLARRNDESSILYLAFGGQIRLGYEINYRIFGSFEKMVASLATGRTAVALRSYDPNITESYLAAGRARDMAPVRVIKPVRHQREQVAKTADSGIVATGHPRGIVYAVRMCERMLENHRSTCRVLTVTAFLGAAAAAALVWGGLLDGTLSLVAALLMGIFMLPSLMLAGKDLWPDADAKSEKIPPSSHTEKTKR